MRKGKSRKPNGKLSWTEGRLAVYEKPTGLTGGFINIIDPKGGPSQKVPVNSSAMELLQSHPQSDSPFAFSGRNGDRRVDIKKQGNRIKERAGLPRDFRAPQGLRHVYASMLASSGEVDMFTLQKLLTHKSPNDDPTLCTPPG